MFAGRFHSNLQKICRQKNSHVLILQYESSKLSLHDTANLLYQKVTGGVIFVSRTQIRTQTKITALHSRNLGNFQDRDSNCND